MANKISTAQQILADNLIADARALVGTAACFGNRKVFLSALLGPVAGQDMSEIEVLMKSGALNFARADLVAAMDPALVAASEWKLNGTTYHFLVVE